MSQPATRPFIALVLLAFIATACGGDTSQPGWTPLTLASSPPSGASGEPGGSGEPESPAPSGPAPTGGPEPTGGGGEAAQVTIGTDTGGALAFDPATASVPSGSTVQLTFENRSDSVPHNLTFGEPINEATEPIVDPGGTEALEFEAPEAGDYQFVCTLHPGMEGTLTVEGG